MLHPSFTQQPSELFLAGYQTLNKMAVGLLRHPECDLGESHNSKLVCAQEF